MRQSFAVCFSLFVIPAMTKLKTVIMFARDNNKLQANPFANIKITRKEKPVEFLTSEEVKQIESKVFDSDRLTKVRDLFLFQCYTGLAYTDMARLKKEDFRGAPAVGRYKTKCLAAGGRFLFGEGFAPTIRNRLEAAPPQALA